jgi:hypothetical protein
MSGSPARDDPQKAAMLSVYAHSLGRRLETQGAPAMLLPSAVRPLPLEDALAQVRAGDPRRHREAAWALLRSAPAPPLLEDAGPLRRRYGAATCAFAEALGFDLEHYDARRARQRSALSLLAAALTAYAGGHHEAFGALAAGGLDLPEHALGAAAGEYVGRIGAAGEDGRRKIAASLCRLQDEVGLSLPEFVAEFADTVAFFQTWDDAGARKPAGKLTVYPAASVVVQDADTLTTTATATTLVMTKDFDRLTDTIEPSHWARESDVFLRSRYVTDDSAGAPKTVARSSTGHEATELLEEQVIVTSGVDPAPVAEFHNVIKIGAYRIEPPVAGEVSGRVDMTYSLGRCLRSRYLWDTRPGGILLDEGYIKVRPVAPDVWRLTVRKIIRFADRTRPSRTDDAFDFGQTLNYIAPGAMTWWLQSEMYSSEYQQDV